MGEEVHVSPSVTSNNSEIRHTSSVDSLVAAQNRGCRLENHHNLSEMEMDLLVTNFLGLFNHAHNCHSKYKENLTFNSTENVSEDEKNSFCDDCGKEYKNLSSYFNSNIVNKAHTKDDICQDILDKMNLMTELYKPHRCDYGVELGLTPLYISILFVSFCVLVYGNCAIKLLQGTKDPGINIVYQNEIFQTTINGSHSDRDIVPSNELENVINNHMNEEVDISNDDANKCDMEQNDNFAHENQNHIQYTNAIVENNGLESNLDGINTDEKDAQSSSVIIVDE